MINRALYQAITVEWPTSKELADKLNKEFAFTLDPCPYGGDVDGLAPLFCSWNNHRVFINPPYGRQIIKWLDRWREAELAVYLLPVRTDTRWFHEIVLPHAAEIRFVRRRLKFGNAVNAAPFPSMIVVFRRQTP